MGTFLPISEHKIDFCLSVYSDRKAIVRNHTQWSHNFCHNKQTHALTQAHTNHTSKYAFANTTKTKEPRNIQLTFPVGASTISHTKTSFFLFRHNNNRQKIYGYCILYVFDKNLSNSNKLLPIIDIYLFYDDSNCFSFCDQSILAFTFNEPIHFCI